MDTNRACVRFAAQLIVVTLYKLQVKLPSYSFPSSASFDFTLPYDQLIFFKKNEYIEWAPAVQILLNKEYKGKKILTNNH
jgi:hypothetical protein